MTSKRARNLLFVLLGIVLLAGCDEDDRYKKSAQVAEKAADRQAAQNTEMAQLNREVAEGTKRMVGADAEARKEIIAVHQEIQTERVTLNDGFKTLEAERKQIAVERRTESLIVPAAKVIGMVVVAIVAIGFCWTLLFGLRNTTTTEAELAELLIHDLTRDEPRVRITTIARTAMVNKSTDSRPNQAALSHLSDQSEAPTQQGEKH